MLKYLEQEARLLDPLCLVAWLSKHGSLSYIKLALTAPTRGFQGNVEKTSGRVGNA